jgi:hypothetical protein
MKRRRIGHVLLRSGLIVFAASFLVGLVSEGFAVWLFAPAALVALGLCAAGGLGLLLSRV